MVGGWRHRSEQYSEQRSSSSDYTQGHRSSGPQAAWVEPGSQEHQAFLSQFMLKSTALSPKSAMQDLSGQLDASGGAATGLAAQQKGAAVRGYKSQPSSPARTRRPASDHAQYGVLTPASAAYGQVAASGGSGTVSSPRGQSGSWGRPSSRPSSNPSPSRGAGHSSGSQMGRTTPSRTAGGSSSRSSSSTASQHKFAYGYEQQQQQQTVQQLGEFFTATSLKVPQRYEQSPYLKSSSRSPQATSGNLTSPRSPSSKSSSTTVGNSGSYSRQQLGSLYSSSPDPVGRMKMGLSSTSASKASASQEGFRTSRGPGALVASGSRGSTPASVSNSTATAQFRSSSTSSSSARYNSGAQTSGSASSSRAATPQASPGGLSAHKQSLHQQQQLRQSQQQQQQPERPASGSHQQLSPAQSTQFLQQPSQPYVSASGQFSGLLISTSSSTVAGRPQTARGSSRAELRAGDSLLTAAGGAHASSSTSGQPGGVNLDPQSWSTFLTLSTSTGSGSAPPAEVGSSSHGGRISRPPSEGAAPGGGSQQRQQQVPAQPLPRNLQAQMLSDLGLEGGSGPAEGAQACATRRISSSSDTQQGNCAGGAEGALNRQPSGPGSQSAAGSACSRSAGVGRTSSSILHAAPPAAASCAAASTAAAPQHQGGPGREPSHGNSGVQQLAHRSSVEECPPSPSAAAGAGASAVPGPLHAGLMRPRSANNILQMAGPPASPVQVMQQQQQVASTPQPSSYLQNLQQQHQQHGSSSPVGVRMSGQPVTPLSALRRRSNASELAAAAAAAAAAASGCNSPAGYAPAMALPLPSGALNDGSSSPAAVSYYQPAQPGSWGVRTEELGGPQVASPRTTILAAQQQLLQGAGASPGPSLRRVGSVDASGVNSGASSPGLSRMQGDWGTLTAMSGFRTSGYGASLAESSTELSCSSPACNSAASWTSMGGAGPPAHLISSMAAAAAAAAAGGAPSTPGGMLAAGGSAVVAGPGPSPLGPSRPSSTTGTPQQAAGGYAGGGGTGMQYQSSSGGIGSYGSPSVGARRALTFSYGGESGNRAEATQQQPTAFAAGTAVLGRQDVAAAQQPQQSSGTASGSYASSRSNSFSMQQQQPAGGGVLPPSQQQAIQQQHQSMEQRLNQLQQMHQAYKQQLQQAARLLDAAAGNSAAGVGSPQQPSVQQQAATPAAPPDAGSVAASAAVPAATADRPVSQSAPTPPAAAAPSAVSRRVSGTSSAAEVKVQAGSRAAAPAAAADWAIPAAHPQPQPQQPAQQLVSRPPSRPSQAQQQPEQQQQKPPSTAPAAAAAATTSGSCRSSAVAGSAQAAAAAAASVPTAARASSAAAAPSTAAAPVSTAAAGTAAAADAGTAAASGAAAPAAAASTTPAAAEGDAGSEPLLLPGYSVGSVVGEGGFCQVRLAVHHLSRRRVAVKVIDKTKLSDAAEARRMQREIRVLKRLNHPCVIRLFEVLEAGSKLLLVMEYAPGGSLLDYVRSRKRLGEAESAYFLQQILTGLQYCHDSEVVHRDIKLENILLDSNRAMKLIDFGLAAFYAPGKKLRVHCGSPSYAAPEIVARKMYEGPPVDVWSLGVVLFAMLAGFLPFHSPTGNKQELCQKIMSGTFNTPDWLSPGARDLLGRMLTVDPEARITIAEAAQHPWTRSSGILWELPSTHCYSLPSSTHGGTTAADRSSIRSSNSSSDSARPLSGGGIPSASGNGDGVEAQSSILEELEGHGYSRPAVVRYLAASECNYITASYYLLAEAKAEAAQKLLPAKPWPFQPVAISSRGSSSSRSRAASSGNATTAAAGAAAAARPASGAGRPPSGVATGYSRPATAVAVSSGPLVGMYLTAC